MNTSATNPMDEFSTPARISSSLEPLAAADNLLVVSDFDGTIAGFATDIYSVPINEQSMNALGVLVGLEDTHVAILSGRHLEGLRKVLGERNGLILAGSHGIESSDTTVELTEQQKALLDGLTTKLDELAAPLDGAYVEHKPFHRVLHYRAVADQEAAAAMVEEAAKLETEGLHLTRGKYILEFSVLDVTKGTWINAAKQRYGSTAVLFIGDDVTDENAMRVLGPDDVGVRVGDGETLATLRVKDRESVAVLLSELAQKRAATVVSFDDPPVPQP